MELVVLCYSNKRCTKIVDGRTGFTNWWQTSIAIGWAKTLREWCQTCQTKHRFEREGGHKPEYLMLLYMPPVEICPKNKGPLGDHPRVGNSMNTQGACVTTSSQPLCEVLLQTSNIKQWQEAVAVSRAYAWNPDWGMEIKVGRFGIRTAGAGKGGAAERVPARKC
jgi:hypothetical protein